MNILKKIQKTSGGITLSLLRVMMGFIMFKEGSEKLFGWFGGRGLEATRAFYDGLSVPFSPYHAVLIGNAEFLGGMMLLTGFLTRVAAAPIAGTMAGALWMVFSYSGTVHHNHLLGLMICLALVEMGSGPLSIDALMSKEKKG